MPPIEGVVHFDLFYTIKVFTSDTHSGKNCFFIPQIFAHFSGTWSIPLVPILSTILYFVTALAFSSVDSIVLLFLEAVHPYCSFMSSEVLTVLIFSHSFIKRLQRDLQSNFDSLADESFNLHGTASAFLRGIGGHTVAKIRSFDLQVVTSFAPDHIFLEVGTNDNLSPEVVGSQIKSLICRSYQ